MEIYKLGLDFDMTDVTLPKLKEEEARKGLNFQSHVDAIFKELTEDITWGSFGVIVGDPNDTENKEPPYVWSTTIIDNTVNIPLNTFLADVKRNPNNYLVLAQLGEELHQKNTVVPCLVMTSEDLNEASLNGIRISKWDNNAAASLNKLSDNIDLTSLNLRWNKYLEEVKKVTNDYKNSICYIPAVCRRDSSDQKVLGGGLVLCVKNNKLSDIFKHLPDIQLFLRLLFTELLIAHRYIGVTVDVPPFVAFLRAKADGINGWFKTSTSNNVRHNFSEMQVVGWLEIEQAIAIFVGRLPRNAETYFALKELSLSGLDTPTMLAILALCAVFTKKSICALTFGKYEPIEGREAKFPCRNIEKMKINKFMLSEFYKYVLSAVKIKNTSDKLIESITVENQSIKILFNSGEYAEKLCSSILQMFSKMIEDRNLRYHDASAHLGRFIIWSGYHFCTEKCTGPCQTDSGCTSQPYVALYKTDSKSELCISIGTSNFSKDN